MSSQNKRGIAYLEREIASCERRIKLIKENPDPTKPKSNIMLYELERDFRIEQRDAYLSGKPLGQLGLGPLTRAMGFVPWDAIMAADRTHGEDAVRYFDVIRKEGMPEHTCDRCSVLIPMLTEGDFPVPDYVETSNFECIPVYLAHLVVSQSLNIPYYHIDRPFRNYKQAMDEKDLKYVTDQLWEMVRDIEKKIPGCHYDEDYMMELQDYDRQYIQCFQDLYKLKANIPCPLAGRESFREVRLADMYSDPKKAVEYMKLYVEEVAEKAAKGIGVAEPEEKLRFLWSVSAPFYADPFSWLEKRGVAIPAAEMTIYNGWFSGRDAIWGDPWGERKLTPMEEEARQIDFTWGRLGDPWVRTHINTCKDLHLDGIVYFVQWGCPTSNNMGRIISDVAENELGIPTLLLEGRMLEKSIFDAKDFFTKLEDFIEVAQANKDARG